MRRSQSEGGEDEAEPVPSYLSALFTEQLLQQVAARCQHINWRYSSSTSSRRVLQGLAKMSMNQQDCAVVRDGFPRPFPDTPSNVLEQFRLTGKVVVVTGAADGIGYAVAEAMAEANANVALWYNSYAVLPVLFSTIRSF